MSARDELPPGWTWAAGLPVSESRGVHVSRGGTSAELAASTWEVWEHRSGITREEYATMRAAVERCAELEVLADGRSEALDVAIGKINKAEAELAKVAMMLAALSVMRDEARRMAEIRLRAIESIRHASMRATPTEGE